MALRLHGWKRSLLSVGAGMFLCASTGCMSSDRHKAPSVTKPMGPGNTVMSPPSSPAFNNLANNTPGIINNNPAAGPQLMTSSPSTVTTTVISPTNISGATSSNIPPMPTPPIGTQPISPPVTVANPSATPPVTPLNTVSNSTPAPIVAPPAQVSTNNVPAMPAMPQPQPAPTRTAPPAMQPQTNVPQYQQVPQMPTVPTYPMMNPTAYGQPMIVVPTQYGLQYYPVQQMQMPMMQQPPVHQVMPQQQGQMMLPQAPQNYPMHPQMMMPANVPAYQAPTQQAPMPPMPQMPEPTTLPNNTMSNIKAPSSLPASVSRPASNDVKGPVLPTSGSNLSLDPILDSRAAPARSVAEGPLKRSNDPSLNLPEDILPAPINAQQR